MDDYRSGEIIPTERKIKQKKDVATIAIEEQSQPEQKIIKFFQVKETCPFQQCGLTDLQGKKW